MIDPEIPENRDSRLASRPAEIGGLVIVLVAGGSVNKINFRKMHAGHFSNQPGLKPARIGSEHVQERSIQGTSTLVRIPPSQGRRQQTGMVEPSDSVSQRMADRPGIEAQLGVAPGRVEVHRAAGQAEAGDGRLGWCAGDEIGHRLAEDGDGQAQGVWHAPTRDGDAGEARKLLEQVEQGPIFAPKQVAAAGLAEGQGAGHPQGDVADVD
jgi:hypothetical protein